MRGPALLDVAQDYALAYLHANGVFDWGVVLKGGTSLRKFRAGNAGRFSTDLDLAVPTQEVGELVLDAIDGGEFQGVEFELVRRSGLRADLRIRTDLGEPEVPARIEASTRPLWLPTASLRPIELPVHNGYEFAMPTMPAPAFEEALAEKLAAWRRRRKMRDLYDLYWFGNGQLDEPLIRRLLVLKVWHDVVNDGLGDSPFNPATITEVFDVGSLPSEDIGLLTQPVDRDAWLRSVQSRYEFVLALDDVETQVARCRSSDSWMVQQLVSELAP